VSKYHKQVIDLLAEGVDYKAVAVQIAKDNPLVFIKAEKASRDPRTAFDKYVCRTFEAEGKLPAVKLVKNEKGWSLLESKQYVEKLERLHNLRNPNQY